MNVTCPTDCFNCPDFFTENVTKLSICFRYDTERNYIKKCGNLTHFEAEYCNRKLQEVTANSNNWTIPQVNVIPKNNILNFTAVNGKSGSRRNYFRLVPGCFFIIACQK